jgi:hypothetical protein
MVSALLVVAMLFLEEQLLRYYVYAKGYRRDAEAGEGALEAVPSAEWSCVSPGLTVGRSVSCRGSIGDYKEAYYRAHGSPFAFPAAAANFLGSNPVREGRGARSILEATR